MSQMPMPRWPLPQMPPGYGEGTGSNNRDSSDWAARHPEDPLLNPQPQRPDWGGWGGGTPQPQFPVRNDWGMPPNGGEPYPYGFASPNAQQKLSGTIGGMVHPKQPMRMSGGGVGIQGPPKPPEPPPIAQPPGWNWQDNIKTAAPPMFGSGYARKV